MSPTPEQRARMDVDAALESAGWIIQDRADMNVAAGTGVAVREFKMASGHGFADFLLFVNGKAVGVLEAKPAGYALTNVELQADKYATGLPAGLNPPANPLPFLCPSVSPPRSLEGLRRRGVREAHVGRFVQRQSPARVPGVAVPGPLGAGIPRPSDGSDRDNGSHVKELSGEPGAVHSHTMAGFDLVAGYTGLATSSWAASCLMGRYGCGLSQEEGR